VWTTLYLLMGISLCLVWTARYKGAKRSAFVLFGAQLVLNALWSLVFFGAHWPWGGVVIIALLLGAIVLTIRTFLLISKPAAYLLVPYALWVSFASALNIAVALIN
jgi:translocator protein